LVLRVLQRDAVGKIKPRFSDDEKTRLVGGNCGSFGQIETGAGKSPVLKFRTHFRELASENSLQELALGTHRLSSKNVKRHALFRNKRAERWSAAPKRFHLG
jgi:hypothetical protein